MSETSTLSLTEFVKGIVAQAKVIRSHDHAIQAKWLALLIRRLKDTDKVDVGFLADIADHLESACVGGTPEVNIDVIGQYGATPTSALNLGRMFNNLHKDLLRADSSFDWDRAGGHIDRLGANYESITRQSCDRFGFTWQEREQLRLSTGQYKGVPWKDLPPVDGHFAHLSTQEKGLLAYTENDDKGARDVQKRIKPGKYLKEYYPNLTGAQIEKLQGAVAVTELQFTSDADLIEKLYTEGPHSCMAGRQGTKGQHPTRCYAGGDLAVAYLLNKNGECSARAVVWPAKKVYHYAYGDLARLNPALKAAGYTQSGAYCFQGARMKKQFRSPGFIHMASFDGHGSFRNDPNDEDFIIVDRNGPLYGANPQMKVPVATTCQCGCGKKGYDHLQVFANGMKQPPQLWIPNCVTAATNGGRIAHCVASAAYVPAELTTKVQWQPRGAEVSIIKPQRQASCLRTASGKWYRRAAFNFVCLDNGELWEAEEIKKSKRHKLNKDGLWEEEVTAKEMEAA